jgi:hypothetical protein
METSRAVLIALVTLLLVVTIVVTAVLASGACSTIPPQAPPVRLSLASGDTVPKRIWQTWHTKDLPPLINKTVQSIKDAHPDFQHTLIDIEECYDFVRAHFPADVAEAHKKLIPASYKSDLWRFCVMYIHGGVYLDVKYECVPPFTFHQLLDNNHFVRDLPPLKNPYTAFFVCKPRDPRLLQCIQQIVKNVARRYYGRNALDPTGPGLLSKFVKYNGPDVTMYLKGKRKLLQDLRFVHDKRTHAMLLRCVPGYKAEQNQYQNTAYYAELWKKRAVYAN